jgi:hypothetical protein
MSHPPPAIVFAGKMAAATRPAANATVASAALRLLPRDQDQPHRGGQDEDRARDRHQRPWHGPGHVPRLSQPSQPGHRAEEVLCLTAVRLAIPPDLSLPGPPGLIASTALAKDCVPGHHRASADRAGAPVI